MDKFEKIPGNKVRKKNKKTGWIIEKVNGSNVGHKGDLWKLYNGEGKNRERIASLTPEGKIVGK